MTRNRKNKYSARKTLAYGIKFDSLAEARYYPVAVDFAKKNECELRLQEAFEIQPKYKRSGKTVRAIKYIPDFTFWQDGKLVKIVDVKGTQTKDFKIKAKIFCYKYDCDLTIAKYDYRTGIFLESVF